MSAISTEEDGTISRLTMESEAHGQYVMNLSPDTVWVDAEIKPAADPSTVKVGDRLYVYHSHVSTALSLPSPPPSPWSLTCPKIWVRPTTTS